MNTYCISCKNELEKQGAILFGPSDETGYSYKRHFCLKCYLEILKLMHIDGY